MSVKKRLQDFIKYLGMAASEFERSIGASNAYVKNISKGIGAKYLEKIREVYPLLNIEWLLTGKGTMLKESYHTSSNEEEGRWLPLIPVEAMAGNGGGEVSITEHDIQARYIVPEFKGADFMIPVKGSSMYPKYNSGDIIACRIIHERTFFQWGRVYVIHHKEQGTMVKRLFASSKEGWLECKSDNPKYPPFEIPVDSLTNIALVIGVIRLE